MKKRIAVIIDGNLSINRQGLINSALSRIRHLKQLDAFDIDVYCIHGYDWGILRLIHKNKRIKKLPEIEVEGIPIRVIYRKKILADLMLESKLQIAPLYSSYCYRKLAKQLKDYDLIVGHSSVGGTLALRVKERFNTPYCVVWHGSDIHSHPLANKYTKKVTSKILSSASANIFVSQSLLNDAQKLFGNVPNSHVAYNAPSEAFVRYNDSERAELREKQIVLGKKVVAFVGNLVPVKNVFTLPVIFERVKKEYKNVVFWIIGHGMHSETLKQKMIEAEVECRFWGNRQPEEMPQIMNCIDVLVLPSKNESFGMVLVEAIACGANAVGSNRGGIPEVIGEENCFDLDERFEERIADRIVYMLNNHVEQSVKPIFDWHQTAKNECLWYSEIVSSCEDREKQP